MNTSISEDLKTWYAISCPTKGVRFDARTLELLDVNSDGHIRTDEVLDALSFLKAQGVSVEQLFNPDKDDERKLQEVIDRKAALAKQPPTEIEKDALGRWEREGRDDANRPCGDNTEEAEKALAEVEQTIDTFFTPPEDLPLVTDAPDCSLPLYERVNPKFADAVASFGDACVKPILGERKELSRADWKRIKAAFAPYRKWKASKPTPNAVEQTDLNVEERLLRYRLHLGEFIRNFVTMDALYDGKAPAIFQTGTLRIDGRELSLCFHVDDEAAHAALAAKSDCCVIYVKLSRPEDKTSAIVCAVVTAGTVAGLYVGRNGVFYDRDGRNWEAVVTRVVESQISLVEAFWTPWKKLGEGLAAVAKKFLAARQEKSVANVQKAIVPPADGAAATPAGGAALASSVAAVGIGVGMLGAACASFMAVISKMGPANLLLSIVALVLVVSLPSVALAWLKLRRRDLAAILNASGWAVNRPMRFSNARARAFTVCARSSAWWCYVLLAAVIVAAVAGLFWAQHCGFFK